MDDGPVGAVDWMDFRSFRKGVSKGMGDGSAGMVQEGHPIVGDL
jgi:hypothetical protein